MDALLPLQATTHRPRRTHSPQFKASVLAACQQPGVSVAAIARQYDLNDNIVHKWLADARRSAAPQPPALSPIAKSSPAPTPLNFMPIKIADQPAPSSAPIRLHLRQGERDLTIEWPADQAQVCLAVLQVLLR